MPRDTLSPTLFPATRAALDDWKAAHDPSDALQMELSDFTPRGSTTYAYLHVRTAPAAPRSTFSFQGADDAALAAALTHFLEFQFTRSGFRLPDAVKTA